MHFSRATSEVACTCSPLKLDPESDCYTDGMKLTKPSQAPIQVLIKEGQASGIECQLACQAVQGAHDREGQLPPPVRRPIDVLGVQQGLVIVEPVDDGRVLLAVQLQLNGLMRIHLLHLHSLMSGCNGIVLQNIAAAILPPLRDVMRAAKSPCRVHALQVG